MDTLVAEYSKIRAVRDEVSSRPITPWLTPDTVPPAYITWLSSTATAGKDAARKRKIATRLFNEDLTRSNVQFRRSRFGCEPICGTFGIVTSLDSEKVKKLWSCLPLRNSLGAFHTISSPMKI